MDTVSWQLMSLYGGRRKLNTADPKNVFKFKHYLNSLLLIRLNVIDFNELHEVEYFCLNLITSSIIVLEKLITN